MVSLSVLQHTFKPGNPSIDCMFTIRQYERIEAYRPEGGMTKEGSEGSVGVGLVPSLVALLVVMAFAGFDGSARSRSRASSVDAKLSRRRRCPANV